MWQKALQPYVESGKVVAIGVVQEQHPARARLYCQWRKLDWPTFVDSLNLLDLTVVPIPVAIDESGIIRHSRIGPRTVVKDFIEVDYPTASIPERYNRATEPDPKRRREVARRENTATAWRDLGDACFMATGGTPGRWMDRPLPAGFSLDRPQGRGSDGEHAPAGSSVGGRGGGGCDPVGAYERAVAVDPGDGRAQFRLGVALRRRSESAQRRSGDAQAAVERWALALATDPNQYIWRRRIQQYGPRLDKPYDFYSWVGAAREEIRARGKTPVPLPVEPSGSELIALTNDEARSLPSGSRRGRPQRRGSDGDHAAACDVGTDSLLRDAGRLVEVETVITPARVRPGHRVRARVSFRLNEQTRPLWNNEADHLTMCVELPVGLVMGEGSLTYANPRPAETREVRHVEFEIVAGEEVPEGRFRVPAYVLYYVCEKKGGKCRFLRQDFALTLQVDADAPSLR